MKGIGVLKTLDRQKGIVSIISTDFFTEQIKELLENLEKYGIEIKYIQEGKWRG